MYKLVTHDDKEVETDIMKNGWLKDFGNYNRVPEPFEQIPEHEYFNELETYSPRYVEYRQLLNVPGQKTMLSMHISWMHDCGLGFSHDYWKKQTTFYRFGCDHDFHEMSQHDCRENGIEHWGMCWHVYKCAKCGYTMSQDSSD